MTAKPLVLLDITRLVSALGRAAPTGVERVELAYARWLMDHPAFEVRFVGQVGGVFRGVEGRLAESYLAGLARLWDRGSDQTDIASALDKVGRFVAGETEGGECAPVRDGATFEASNRAAARFRRLMGVERIATVQQPVEQWAQQPLEGVVRGAHATGRPIVYLNVTHDRIEKARACERLKALAPVRMMFLCHDVIPAEFPEYARPGAAERARRRLRTMGRFADGILVNSGYTASRIAAHLPEPLPPVRVAHLGTDPRFLEACERPSFLAGHPYFVVVSTIEARKNHLLLLQLWRTLAERGGVDVPKLVIVGRRGWEAESAVAMLERSPAIRPHVLETGPLPDAALHQVIASARCLLMPSFVEGFGMPVVEALACRVPVIASDIPVFREIGQGIPDLVDPIDGFGWAKAVLDHAGPASRLRARQLERLAGFRAVRWEEHFQVVESLMETTLAASAGEEPRGKPRQRLKLRAPIIPMGQARGAGGAR